MSPCFVRTITPNSVRADKKIVQNYKKQHITIKHKQYEENRDSRLRRHHRRHEARYTQHLPPHFRRHASAAAQRREDSRNDRSDLVEAFPVLEPMDKEKAAECTATYREIFEDAVVVGDTHFDILMGRNAHCMTIGVTYGNGLRESLMEAGADAIVDDFAEIAEIV